MQWRQVRRSWSNVFSSLLCSNRNRSALVHELLSNNSLFVSQLYEDESCALHTRDLIYFTTDLQQFTARADLFLTTFSRPLHIMLCINKSTKAMCD